MLSTKGARFIVYMSLVCISVKYLIHCLLTHPDLTPASDQLRLALVRGFPTEFTSLREVQHLVAILKQTAAEHPVYVLIIYGVAFIERRIFPAFDLEQFITFVRCYIITLPSFKFLKAIWFSQSHEFYLNAMATPLTGDSPWLAFLLCSILSFSAEAVCYCLIQAAWRLQCRLENAVLAPQTARIGRLELRLREVEPPGDQNQANPAPAEEAEDVPIDIPPEQTREILRNFLLYFFIPRCAHLVLGWHLFMSLYYENMCNRRLERFWTVARLSAIFLLSPLCYAPYTWYCVSRRITELDVPDGLFQQWWCQTAVFTYVCVILALVMVFRFLDGA